MKRFAVLGNPIGHSKSPVIHNLFAQQFGHEIDYQALLVPVDGFQTFMHHLIAKQYIGCNVTLPFKEQAFAMATKLSERARLAEAVNTLSFQDGEIIADNTDGQGLVEDLCRLLGDIQGKSIVLIGAGGAAKGSVFPLLEAGVSKIIVTNRTIEKAQAMVSRFYYPEKLTVVGLNDVEEISADVIVNSTSSSINNDLPFESTRPFESAELAYDMFYKDELTAFEKKALSVNSQIKTANGIGMLVGQAAESYRIWHGKKPDIAQVISAL